MTVSRLLYVCCSFYCGKIAHEFLTLTFVLIIEGTCYLSWFAEFGKTFMIFSLSLFTDFFTDFGIWLINQLYHSCQVFLLMINFFATAIFASSSTSSKFKMDSDFGFSFCFYFRGRFLFSFGNRYWFWFWLLVCF